MPTVRPQYRVQIFAQTWTRDSKPTDPKWITISAHKTYEAAQYIAKQEKQYGRKSRIQTLNGPRYKTLDSYLTICNIQSSTVNGESL